MTRRIAGLITPALALYPSRTLLDRSDLWMPKQGEHAWLEEVQGEAALKWVVAQNNRTFHELGDPSQSATYHKVKAALESKDKIPGVRKIGPYYYNFWQDQANARGLLRRTLPEHYVAGDKWETVLDVDALGREEKESWVWKGHTLLKEYDGDKLVRAIRTLVALSPGGSDAVVRREFDLEEKKFVEDGFVLPVAKSRVSWKDRDTLLVGMALDEGEKTTSGYPRVVREWKRGTRLEDAPIVFEGQESDVSVGSAVTRSKGVALEWRSRSYSFYASKRLMRKLPDGVWYDMSKLGVPDDVDMSQYGSSLLLELRTEWLGFKSGSLLAVDVDDLLRRGGKAHFDVLFEPTPATSLVGRAATKNMLILNVIDTVRSKLVFLAPDPWRVVGEDAEPRIRTASVGGVDVDESDDYFLRTSSFLEPSTLSLVSGDTTTLLKSLPDLFNHDHTVSQYLATSKDGTQVPYFCVSTTKKGPCLLYGYGGFEISVMPSYAATVGAWLERGGTYVVANIRGGGEFGPDWHKAALRENRQKAYDDFFAVAQDLVARGIVDSPSQIGIRGGSNGGMLVGNAYVQRPDLFGAVVCAVPLLDMRCYNRLLAGASWQEEYGYPDTQDWDNFLKKYSPYHQIDPDQQNYPPLLLTTSTKDDRVSPYHARSFVHRLNVGLNNQRVWYYENVEGGHGGAADADQAAFVTALYQDFLFDVLSNPPPPPKS